MTRKIHFTISEIAKESKVKKSQIRSYEKKGLISPSNDKLGRRIYDQFDRARLELIFHFEHIDYSPDQISELLGIPDVNLNKMEQFRKSLEYGEKKLDELEKRSKDIKFPDRISVINEINMMGNYIEELKNIEPSNSVTEKKPKQKHIRMIPIYTGLSFIILFIAGYFFYQGGTILNLAQKKPSETEVSPVSLYPVPPDDTGHQQNVDPRPFRTPDSPLPVHGEDSFIKESKQCFDKEPIIDKPETVIPSQTAPNIGAEKVPLLSTESKDAVIDVEGSEASPEQNGLEVLQVKALLEESGSVKKNEDIAIKLNQLDSKNTQLSPVSIAPDEKKQTDYKLSTLSDVKKTKLNTDQNNSNEQNYMVSLYYTSDENRAIVDELASLLKTEGFDILGIKKVDYQYRDIRYFHNEDKPGALFLQKISNRSFTRLMNIEDINIKIKNLSNEYPNARKGALELWTNI